MIVSAGGTAYPALGSRGELFPVLEGLGHTVLPKRPALAPLLADLGNLKPLQGVRLNVGAALWNGSQAPGLDDRKPHFYRMGIERSGRDGSESPCICPTQVALELVSQPAGIFPGRI